MGFRRSKGLEPRGREGRHWGRSRAIGGKGRTASVASPRRRLGRPCRASDSPIQSGIRVHLGLRPSPLPFGSGQRTNGQVCEPLKFGFVRFPLLPQTLAFGFVHVQRLDLQMPLTKDQAIEAAREYLRGQPMICPACSVGRLITNGSASLGEIDVSCGNCDRSYKLSVDDDVRLKNAPRWTLAQSQSIKAEVKALRAVVCPVCKGLTKTSRRLASATVICFLCRNIETFND
jgi:hypothetical protein